MEHQSTKTRPARRPEVIKVFLLGAMSVQAFGAMMGLGLIILNLTH